MADTITANIDTFLEKIQTSIYGRDVRSAIHDSIKQCYIDGRSLLSAKVNDEGHLILTFRDEHGVETTTDYGNVRGPQGDVGPAGDINKLIVSAQTGAPGTDVTVTQVKTSDDKWDVTFTIPQGLPGDGKINTVDNVEPINKNVALNAVSYGKTQNLTDAQKLQALTNLGVTDCSRYTLTLAPEKWTGDTAPYTYTITFTDTLPNGDLFISAANTVTAEQYAEFGAGKLMATSFADNKLTITAYGAKPTIALDVSFMIMPYLFGTPTVKTGG